MQSSCRSLFITCLFVTALAFNVSLGSNEQFPLQGEWKAVSYVEDGEAAVRLEKTPIRWLFEKEQFTIIAEDQQVFKIKGTFKIDTKSQPPLIDLHTEKQADAPAQKMLGIYLLEKGKLKLCYATEGKRPTEFVSKSGSNTVLITFEKTK